MSLVRVFVIVCLLLWGGELQARRGDVHHGKVINVADGDTVALKTQDGVMILRLYGIDTPEKAQQDGNKATAFTRRFVLGKRCRIKVMDRDRYGRYVALVFVNGRSLNEALLAAGWAWHYKKFSRSKRFAMLEQNARRARLGVWARANPTPPWTWRYRQYRKYGKRRYRRRGRYRRGRRRTYRKYRPHRRRYKPRTYKDEESRPSMHRPSKKKLIYRGNRRSHVFHAPGCRYYKCRNCVIELRSLKQAKKQGFRPHKRCVFR